MIIWLSGPVNPRANSTRSQGHTFSEPSISTNFAFSFGFFIHSTSIVFNAFTFPLPSFINSFVKIDHCLLLPSSWDELVLSVNGQYGQGFSSVRSLLGFGKISKFTTDFAPCLLDVPIQSDPVSPPPITITFLFLALSSSTSLKFSPITWFCFFKKCIAWTTPLSSWPGIGKLLITVAPPHNKTTSLSFFNFLIGISIPTSTLVLNLIPSRLKISTLLSIIDFSSLKSGIPYLRRPPTLESLS